MAYILETENITKKFPDSHVTANSGIDFSLTENEIHAVVGENGSGKSTLMHVISGLFRPDSGRIMCRGKTVDFFSPFDAFRAGIGMIHQVPGIVPGFSALENIIIGNEGKWFERIDRKKALYDVEKIRTEYNLSVDLQKSPETTEAKQLTVLLALIYRGAEIIIFDEPTASLSDDESAGFFRIIRKLKSKGKTVVFVTHKIAAALSVAEKITVLSRGRKKGTFSTEDTDIEDIARLITGENYTGNRKLNSSLFSKNERQVVFEAKDIIFPGKKPPAGKISFSVKEGEILSFSGIRENNLDLLENLLSGFYRPAEGALFYLGREITGSSIRSMRRSGIKYIPSDRLGRGTSMTATVESNISFTHLRDFSQRGFIQTEKVRDFFNTGKNAFSIDASYGQPLWQLSGGNIQKVILFREIHKAKRLLVFCEPSWNLDIKSREMVYNAIAGLKNRGAAVIIISTDIEEVVDVSDRVAVMYQGRIAGFLEGEDISSRNIARLMLGLGMEKGSESGRSRQNE